MNQCEPQVFERIGQMAWFCISNILRDDWGVPDPGTSGQATKNGITIAWNLDPQTSILSLQCIDKPESVECDVINQNFDYMVDACTPF